MGLIGLSHDHVWDLLPDMAANEHVELVAATSTKPPLLERIGKEFGVATYTDSAEMAAGDPLDAVCLFGDNRAGAEEGVKALERGFQTAKETRKTDGYRPSYGGLKITALWFPDRLVPGVFARELRSLWS